MARQKGAKKRSLQVVNEHFEPLFNAASAALGINQSLLNFKHVRSMQRLSQYHSVTRQEKTHVFKREQQQAPG